MDLRPAPRKRRSDHGVGKKLTNRMVAAIKRRLLNNSRMTVSELREKVSGLSEGSLSQVN